LSLLLSQLNKLKHCSIEEAKIILKKQILI